MQTDEQILKSRDDKAPITFSTAGVAEASELFKLADACECSWLEKDESFGPAKLRPRIEPWLTALFQSEHLALLVGSGLSHAVHGIATDKPLPGMNPVKFSHFDAEINGEAKTSAALAGRDKDNIEDQIRVANELLSGLEIMEGSKKDSTCKAAGLKNELQKILENFAESILLRIA